MCVLVYIYVIVGTHTHTHVYLYVHLRMYLVIRDNSTELSVCPDYDYCFNRAVFIPVMGEVQNSKLVMKKQGIERDNFACSINQPNHSHCTFCHSHRTTQLRPPNKLHQLKCNVPPIDSHSTAHSTIQPSLLNQTAVQPSPVPHPLCTIH